MARSRAQRRRVSLGVLTVLVATFLVLVFARDVSRAAHNATTARRSEDLSFAALANALLASENQVDARLAYLLAHGSGLSRPVLGARLDQLAQVVASWPGEGRRLRSPHVAHDVNVQIDDLTQTRAAATMALIGSIERALALPLAPGTDVTVATNPADALRATSLLWNRDRFALVREPGHARLLATSAQTPGAVAAGGLTALERSRRLALVRAVGIAAVRVVPAPLPAPAGTLVVPPVSRVTIDVSVANLADAVQPVVVTLSVTPLNGRGSPSTQRARATLAPLGGWAFSLAPFVTAPSERARVVVRVAGARAGSSLPTQRTYTLVLSPSGVG